MRDPNLVRKEMLALNEVLPFVIMPTEEGPSAEAQLPPVDQTEAAALPTKAAVEALRDIKGDLINMAAQKLQNFVKNGTDCARCKCEGEYFGKEKYARIPFYHLNLYAMKKGRETQMLKDYIKPLEKGGTDTLDNCHTLCFDCHKKKVNPPADLEARARKRAKKRRENRAKKAAGEVKVKVGEKKPRRV